jgi:hypothetical protein
VAVSGCAPLQRPVRAAALAFAAAAPFDPGMYRPAGDEFPAYYHAYVARVPDGDILRQLRCQQQTTLALLADLDEAQALHRYADGKWSIKQVLGHVADGERVMCYRALCMARGDRTPLPGFDENLWAQHDGADARPLPRLLDEFAAVRTASITLFAGFDAAAWQRRGVANGADFTVGSFAWILAGHELHHVTILRERYGVGA